VDYVVAHQAVQAHYADAASLSVGRGLIGLPWRPFLSSLWRANPITDEDYP
jgi:hypothetical protein